MMERVAKRWYNACTMMRQVLYQLKANDDVFIDRR